MYHAKKLFLTSVLLLSAGCVTIINGTTQDVPVYSYPVAAQIVVLDEDGTQVYSGSTNGRVTLKRSHVYTIRAKAPGYADAEAIAEPTTSGGAVVGAFLGMFVLTPIGTIVDLVNGSCKEHDEEGLEITLLRQSTGAANAGIPVAFHGTTSCGVRLMAPEM
jgi:hypothetical protein